MTDEELRRITITPELLRAEDDATDCVHLLSLVAELLELTGREAVTLSTESADGLALVLTRAMASMQGVLNLLAGRDAMMAAPGRTEA